MSWRRPEYHQERLVTRLTTAPQMNKAVSIDKQSATSVAAQFLKANGIV